MTDINITKLGIYESNIELIGYIKPGNYKLVGCFVDCDKSTFRHIDLDDNVRRFYEHNIKIENDNPKGLGKFAANLLNKKLYIILNYFKIKRFIPLDGTMAEITNPVRNELWVIYYHDKKEYDSIYNNLEKENKITKNLEKENKITKNLEKYFIEDVSLSKSRSLCKCILM